MSLEDTLAKLKVRIEGSTPPERVAIMHQATRDLEASGIGARILKAGDQAPTFNLLNQNGELVSSTALLQKGPLVLTFYRGIWCPYCNTDLGNLKRYTAQLEEKGASLLAISPQLATYSQQVVERQRLNFDLLHDPENTLAAQFGLRWEMVGPLKNLYDNTFNINLPTYNGDPSWTLPVPARFIIGSDGIIQYAEYSVDYTKRPNPDVLVEAMA